mmetsp:Transcript_442/g.1293  ORF Transcript_442/g.1293 Transcript_442/m.1293 type:complete len:224 (+) Transcript_442:404-1075(+)
MTRAFSSAVIDIGVSYSRVSGRRRPGCRPVRGHVCVHGRFRGCVPIGENRSDGKALFAFARCHPSERCHTCRLREAQRHHGDIVQGDFGPVAHMCHRNAVHQHLRGACVVRVGLQGDLGLFFAVFIDQQNIVVLGVEVDDIGCVPLADPAACHDGVVAVAGCDHIILTRDDQIIAAAPIQEIAGICVVYRGGCAVIFDTVDQIIAVPAKEAVLALPAAQRVVL